MQKILVMEDNDEINGLLCEMLRKNGFEAKAAFSGTEGLLYLSSEAYELVLLDLMLPGKSGEQVLKEIRQQSDVPIIIISAKSDMDGKVELLEHGADDYITKPFDVREVMARIRLQLKNDHQKSAACTEIEHGEIRIEPELRKVSVCSQPLNLTKQEYEILLLLLSNPNKIFTKQELYEGAWNEYYIGEDKTINVHISNIRNKIKAVTDTPYIETVWGIGFRACKPDGSFPGNRQ